MKLLVTALTVAASLLLACSTTAPGAARDAPSASAGVAGVREVEDRWSEAFLGGDAAYLTELLDPAYVSLGTNGAPHDKAAVIAAAQRYAAQHPGSHATPMPPTSTIDIKGSTAVVQHRGADDASVDVFYFEKGRWHAWYSQHAKKTPS